ncbi:MAG: biotin--[acetyl-CoA-carboxylase] ligase [Chloroflexi bacterium]|jgi:BirA family biotin operon repressor/biotin-[acetyl-CoA-carboxylase] ligase|nr:biotin--[acetyl-CoA-carboxylase] ligase [Anaerolineaceae bacterium]NLI44498.1 biotin--[acetyl-CoA-carboxylase] ligase [Chloroflexota bacterium]HOE34875.1 biotin--[acetyl-CoA-carboxylase] ligase [Anaerolineaceae bacterium]HOT25997.1 biotin--[acetyl-CoA-carboxylase] ligase [Anaerolineaceae bacterium]HQK04019.1 biotin--[acetyl-CoA-carboxylase] ligase [Anaerolineaceae bacterium]
MAAGSDVPPFKVILLAETNSTNDDCLRLAENGAPDGTVVRALHQTAGRGREGRSWFSRPDASLTFSVLLRPAAQEYPFLTRFTLLGCLALARALENHFGVISNIKWPNDVLIAGKKVCGVLTETLWQGQIPTAVVIGMGVNLSNAALPPASEAVFPAGSLEGQAGLQLSPRDLLEMLLPEIWRAREELAADSLIDEINARLAFKGEWVRLRKNADAPLKARPLWVEKDGCLCAEADDGRIERFYSAEISA